MPALQRWSGLEIDGELVWFKVLGFVSCKACWLQKNCSMWVSLVAVEEPFF